MDKKSYKSIIQKYVVLKINSGEWKNNLKIPSENQIASKFNCSRLTARDALQSLVNSGVLVSKQGMGYLVSGNDQEAYLKSFAISHNVKKTEIEILKNFSWINDFFNFKDDNRKIYILKRYWDKKGLLATQFTILNKSIIWEVDLNAIKKSITKYLAVNGVTIKYSNIIIKTFSNEHSFLKNNAKSLGWDSEYFPVEIVRSYSNDGWVEKTIRLTRGDSFGAIFTKRTYI